MSEEAIEELTKEKKKIRFCKKHLVFLAIAVITIALMAIKGDSFIEIIKGATVALALVYFSVEDIKSKTISNKALLILLGVGIIETLASFNMDILINAVGSAGIMAIIMFILYFISHGNFGSGDVKLIIIITLFLLFNNAVQMVFMALVLTCLWGIGLMILKKGSIKMELPMVPFLAIALMLNALMETFF